MPSRIPEIADRILSGGRRNSSRRIAIANATAISKSPASKMNPKPTPSVAITRPTAAGTANLVMLKAMEFKAKAFRRFSLGTSEGISDILFGSANTQPTPISPAKRKIDQVVATPRRTIAAKPIARAVWQTKIVIKTRRRSQLSANIPPIGPASNIGRRSKPETRPVMNGEWVML